MLESEAESTRGRLGVTGLLSSSDDGPELSMAEVASIDGL